MLKLSLCWQAELLVFIMEYSMFFSKEQKINIFTKAKKITTI